MLSKGNAGRILLYNNGYFNGYSVFKTWIHMI